MMNKQKQNRKIKIKIWRNWQPYNGLTLPSGKSCYCPIVATDEQKRSGKSGSTRSRPNRSGYLLTRNEAMGSCFSTAFWLLIVDNVIKISKESYDLWQIAVLSLKRKINGCNFYAVTDKNRLKFDKYLPFKNPKRSKCSFGFLFRASTQTPSPVQLL